MLYNVPVSVRRISGEFLFSEFPSDGSSGFAVLSMGLFQACRKHIDRFCERDSSNCIELCNYEVLLWRLCIGWKVCARRLFSDVAGGLFVLLRYFGRIGFPYRNVLRQSGIVCRNDSFLPNLSFDGTAVTDAR